MLNRSSQRRYPCVPDFREKAFNLSLLSITTAMGFFFKMSFTRPRKFLSTCIVLSVFNHEMEKGMAVHCSVLAWRIPWMEGPGGLQSMGSHRVGHK